MEVYVFFKRGGGQSPYPREEFVERFSGSKEGIIAAMKNETHNRLFWLADAFAEGKYSEEDDTQNGGHGGVHYIIDDKVKAEQQIRDIQWIQKVREFAKSSFPNDSTSIMHVIEYYRMLRKGKKDSYEKCLSRLKKRNVAFNPIEINWK